MSDQTKDTSVWTIDGVRYAHSSGYVRRRVGEDQVIGLQRAKHIMARYDVGNELLMVIDGASELGVVEKFDIVPHHDRFQADFDVRIIERADMTHFQKGTFEVWSRQASEGQDSRQFDFGTWIPFLSVVEHDGSLIRKVSDWTGRPGEKPAVGVYCGQNGFVVHIDDAVPVEPDLLKNPKLELTELIDLIAHDLKKYGFSRTMVSGGRYFYIVRCEEVPCVIVRRGYADVAWRGVEEYGLDDCGIAAKALGSRSGVALIDKWDYVELGSGVTGDAA